MKRGWGITQGCSAWGREGYGGTWQQPPDTPKEHFRRSELGPLLQGASGGWEAKGVAAHEVFQTGCKESPQGQPGAGAGYQRAGQASPELGRTLWVKAPGQPNGASWQALLWAGVALGMARDPFQPQLLCGEFIVVSTRSDGRPVPSWGWSCFGKQQRCVVAMGSCVDGAAGKPARIVRSWLFKRKFCTGVWFSGFSKPCFAVEHADSFLSKFTLSL